MKAARDTNGPYPVEHGKYSASYVTAFAGLTASTHPAVASAAISFDFMMPALSTYRRSRN